MDYFFLKGEKLSALNKAFIDKLSVFYDKIAVYDVQKSIEQEKQNLKWLQDNLGRLLGKASEKLMFEFKESYGKVKSKFEGLINPVEDTADIFVAHSDISREIRHTGTLAYFLKDKEILKAFLHKFKMYNFDEFIEKGLFKVVPEYCIYNKEYDKECRFDIIIFFGSDKNASTYNSSVIIEAKIHSKENIYRINQKEVTQKELYQKTIAENPNLFGKCTCLYLTLENEDDMTNNFENITWLDILATLQKYVLYMKPDNRKSAYLVFLQLWIGSFLGGVYKCPKAKDFENKKSLKNKDKLISFITQLADNGEE